MPNLSIKDVPEDWAEALRQRAARNHRSLQGELMALVEAAISPSASSTTTPGRLNLEQWAAARAARFPVRQCEGPSSVEMIREDRDSR